MRGLNEPLKWWILARSHREHYALILISPSPCSFPFLSMFESIFEGFVPRQAEIRRASVIVFNISFSSIRLFLIPPVLVQMLCRSNSSSTSLNPSFSFFITSVFCFLPHRQPRKYNFIHSWLDFRFYDKPQKMPIPIFSLLIYLFQIYFL